MHRYAVATVVACVAGLAGCAVPPGPPPAAYVPQPVAGFNTTPLVTGQSPAGYFGTSGPNQPFESINSLPVGAYNRPVVNP